MTALAVLLDGRLAGSLSRERGRLTLAYEDRYRLDPDATPLSVAMPLRVVEHPDAVAGPWFRGLLPDDDAVLRRWGRQFSVSTPNTFGLLAEVGRDCPGAVQVLRQEQAEDEGIDWLSAVEVGEILRTLRADRTSWLPTGASGRFSLAGAQAKTALHREAERWGRPRGRTPTTHILKPAIEFLDDHDLNEHLCLAAARLLGLPAAASEVLTFDGERVVAIERYDRVRQDGAWRRVHQEDLCQALGVWPDLKYQSEGGPSAADVVRLLRATIPEPEATEAVSRFVDALALSWLLLGTDAHAKNYSLLLSGSQVRLAPLYDLASALVYPQLDLRRLRLAMKIGKSYDPAWVGRSDWLRVADLAGLDGPTVLARVAALADRLPDALATASASVSDVDSPLPVRLVDAVALHARACAARLTA